MIINIKKKIKIEKYSINGIKIYLKHKNNWFCIKLNNKEVLCLKFIIDSICE